MKFSWKYPPALQERLMNIHHDEIIQDNIPVTASTMRGLVIKELLALLNHTNIENILDDQRYPQLASSAINYGIPRKLAYDSQHDWQSVGREIHKAILRFEPRIIPETLVVRVLNAHDPVKYAVVFFELSALIYWFPEPIDLCVKANYDVGADKVTLE